MGNVFSGSNAGTDIRTPYGQLPYQIGGEFGGQLESLGRAFGFGMGRNYAGFENRLGQAQGPLAGVARDVQSFAPSIYPEFLAAGQQVQAQGEPAYQQAQAQINQALGAANQGYGYAQQFAQSAFSPVSQQPLFEEASTRLIDSIRPGLAARGLASSGAGQQAETDATRDLSFSVMQNQQAQQQAAVPLLQQAGAAGIAPAQQGLANLQQLGQILTAPGQYGLQGLQSILGLLTSPQQGAQGLLSQVGPQLAPYSKSAPFGLSAVR